MKKKQIGGLIIAAVLFIAVGISSVLTNTVSQRMLESSVETLLTGNYILTRRREIISPSCEWKERSRNRRAPVHCDVSSGYQHTDNSGVHRSSDAGFQ